MTPTETMPDGPAHATGGNEIHPRPLDAFAHANIDVLAPHRIRVVGQEAVRTLPFTEIAFIVAWDPDAKWSNTTAINQARADLIHLAAMMGATVLPSRRSDQHSDHGEDCVAILGLRMPRLLLLGRAFHQVAIVQVTRTQVAIIPCGGGPPVRMPRVADPTTTEIR